MNSEYFRIRNTGTSPHIGVDLKASIGTSVYALGEAEVVEKGTTKSGIKYLTVEFSNGDKHRYLHLSKVADNLEVGNCLEEGQIIAYTGNSGTYGKKKKQYPPHLHIDAVNSKGEMIDPLGKNYGKMTNKEFFGEIDNSDNSNSTNSSSIPMYTVKTKGGALNMRDKPSLKSEVTSSIINGGQLIGTGKTKGNWIEVKSDNKDKGWIHKNYVKKNL